MNRTRRENITGVIKQMNNTLEILDRILDEESFAMESYPENLQGTDIYFNMEDAVDTMSSVIDNISDSIEQLESII